MKEILTERNNLFEPNVYITMCVELTGKICPHQLTAAIKEAYKANEATMSRIVLEYGTAYYEKLSVSGCKTMITDKNWIELVRENEKLPFEIDKGELVRTFIIPADTDTQIMIMAHHLVGDGKSIIYLIKDMMNALAKKTLTYKPLVLLKKNSFSDTRLSVSAKLYAHYCKRKWKDCFFTWQDYYNLHNKYWETTCSDIQYKTLSVSETEQIIEKAKQIGCSVNSYLVTMFLQKYQKKCEVGIPISIRESKDESMSNLTSGIRIKHRFDTKKTFAENAMQVDAKIKSKLQSTRVFVLRFLAELPMTLIDAVLLNTHDCYSNQLAKQTAKIMGYIGKTRNLGITNLTVIDIPVLYKSYKIKNIIFVPPAVSYAHNIIGISTVNGKMTFSFHKMVRRYERPSQHELG